MTDRGSGTGSSVRAEVSALPKAELHVHIEGTLEPELMFEIAARNQIELPFADAAAARRAYVFADLRSFLDAYYAGCSVLVEAQDFYDLTRAYLERAAADGVRHTEIFFDPQTHTNRGIPFSVVIEGISAALTDSTRDIGLSSRLILCFLRDLSADAAMATFEAALAHREVITAVGLDSAETGNPPAKFRAVFDRARAEGLFTVAHAGEEGPPAYIREALDVLGVKRIDHGIRCLEDPALVERLVAEQVPLTVCPVSNAQLGAVPSLERHPLKRMLELGLMVTINSDDPAYFGAYIAATYDQTAAALSLDDTQLAQIARNSFRASFLGPDDQRRGLDAIDELTGSV